MNSFERGRKAETIASAYLSSHGFDILQYNWRSRWCEIDIVASRNQAVYVIEVKYRSSAKSGSGLDYITPSKLSQMHRAAESWVQAHNWNGNYFLGVIEVSGPTFRISAVEFDI